MAYVYVLQHTALPMFKIGKAVDVLRRAASIGQSAFDFTRSYALACRDERDALRVEAVLHRVFAAHRKARGDVDTKLSDGATEWFDSACRGEVDAFVQANAGILGVEIVGTPQPKPAPTPAPSSVSQERRDTDYLRAVEGRTAAVSHVVDALKELNASGLLRFNPQHSCVFALSRDRDTFHDLVVRSWYEIPSPISRKVVGCTSVVTSAASVEVGESWYLSVACLGCVDARRSSYLTEVVDVLEEVPQTEYGVSACMDLDVNRALAMFDRVA